MKKTALVICPGRGTYNKPELGYIQQHSSAQYSLLQQLDNVRAELNLATVTGLDQQPHFKTSLHGKAENAAALIFAAGMTDYQAIDTQQFNVVAITGNSMGWYTALGCANVWQPDAAMRIVSSMAQVTADAAGGQFIYPLVNENWQTDPQRVALVQQQLAQHRGELFMSICYGGYAVLAGTSEAVTSAMQALPPCDERFPLLLHGHVGFHSPLMQQAADRAQQLWSAEHFSAPLTPLIDGRGHIWQSYVADTQALQRYTLGHQVSQTYDFSLAVQVAVKEFAPQHIILLGPGAGLGGAVAQSLIAINWQGLSSKQDFIAAQQASLPLVLSMGLAEQRALLLKQTQTALVQA